MIYRNKTLILLSVLIILITMLFLGCDKKEYAKYPFKNILINEDIFDLVKFKDSIYAGGKNGLFKISIKDYSFNKVKAIKANYIKDLAVYNNELYIGYDLGIIKYDGKNYTELLNKKSNVKDIRVNTIYFDSNGALWAGTYDGVLKYKNKIWTHLTENDGLLSSTIFLILEDDLGGMIFGHYATNKSGISYLKNKKWEYFTIKSGLPHNYITSGFVNNNFIYIGTGFYDKGGIAILKSQKDGLKFYDSIVKTWGENGSKVRSIEKDSDLLLVGTEYNGLCLYKNDHFKKYTINNGLIGNEVKKILILNNQLWIGTKKGISIINKKSLYTDLDLIE